MKDYATELAALGQIRGWLASGATIKATDPKGPILRMNDDGSCTGGLTITFPATGLIVSGITLVQE